MLRFIKNWSLPLAMLLGAAAYLLYAHLSCFDFMRPWAGAAVSVLQPLLVCVMLFLSFLKIPPHTIRPHAWHLRLLLWQVGLTALLVAVLWGGAVVLGVTQVADMPGAVVVEGAMLCLLCPTATAAVVVVGKLGGDVSGVAAYTLLINVAVALVVPAASVLLHPHASLPFAEAFALILGRVVPVLIFPLVLAMLVRHFAPALTERLLRVPDLPFYLWNVCLSLAICVTVKSIAHSDQTLWELCGLGLVSLLCCVLQFWLGHRVGERVGQPVAASQSFGQKNTALAIWVGYTFFIPVTAVAPGLYAIWHNVWNTVQLRRAAAIRQAPTARA